MYEEGVKKAYILRILRERHRRGTKKQEGEVISELSREFWLLMPGVR